MTRLYKVNWKILRGTDLKNSPIVVTFVLIFLLLSTFSLSGCYDVDGDLGDPFRNVIVEFLDPPIEGNINTEINFLIRVTDRNGRDVKLTVDWGDFSPNYQSGYKPSGTEFSVSHSWRRDYAYVIKATGENTMGQTGQRTHTIRIGPTTCLAAGTEITLADGSIKNVENISIGERVLSYDLINDDYSSWIVSKISKPIHPICEINDGLISITKEHPIFIKKQNGDLGWGAIEPLPHLVRIKGEMFTLEIGDYIYSKNGEWIQVKNITCNNDLVQTYNILSLTGDNSYFANDILVFEDLPPVNYMLKWRLGKFLELRPRLIPLLYPLTKIL